MTSRVQYRLYAEFDDRSYDSLLNEIAPLRFEGANVVISLSTHPDDILLIHSALLERSQYFQTGLSYRWSTSGKHIGTDSRCPAQETLVHKYGLVLDADKDGYTLVGNSLPDKDPISQKEEAAKGLEHTDSCIPHPSDIDYCEQHMACKPVDFHRSTYCHSMPSDYDLQSTSPLYLSKAHQHAVRDHKILFALLYQLEVDLRGLWSDELVTCLANVAAYAEYYGLLPFVAKYLEEGLQNPVAYMHRKTLDRPTYWLALGYMLRSESIFADALRHFAGGHWIHCFAENNPGWQDVILLTYKKQLELAQRISSTDRELYRLTLVPDHQGSRRLGGPPRFTFLSQKKGAKKTKSEEAKARYLARKALGEWLADNLCFHYCSTEKSRGTIYRKLLRLATRGDIRMFGTEAPSRLSSIFNIKMGQSKRPPEEIIEMEMRKALREVKEVLERYLFNKDYPPAKQEPQEIDDYDKWCYYLTHIRIESGEMPWVMEDPWMPITPNFEIKAASEGWLDQVGLGHLK